MSNQEVKHIRDLIRDAKIQISAGGLTFVEQTRLELQIKQWKDDIKFLKNSICIKIPKY